MCPTCIGTVTACSCTGTCVCRNDLGSFFPDPTFCSPEFTSGCADYFSTCSTKTLQGDHFGFHFTITGGIAGDEVFYVITTNDITTRTSTQVQNGDDDAGDHCTCDRGEKERERERTQTDTHTHTRQTQVSGIFHINEPTLRP